MNEETPQHTEELTEEPLVAAAAELPAAANEEQPQEMLADQSTAVLTEAPLEETPAAETSATALSEEQSADQLEDQSPPTSALAEAAPAELPSDDLPNDDVADEFLITAETEASEPRAIVAAEETVSAETATDTAIDAAAAEDITATREELQPVIEALLFVADEPLSFKQLCKVLGEIPEADVKAALEELAAAYEERGSGLELREIAGGWRISTRPQHHEFIRKYLKSRPSARLSLPALETLAVIAYKQPITVPEILELRGVSSSSAIKTLLEKRLIVTKGRKETVGRPMMYGTSKEFMIQFGLKDLTELPSIEDFEDLAQ